MVDIIVRNLGSKVLGQECLGRISFGRIGIVGHVSIPGRLDIANPTIVLVMWFLLLRMRQVRVVVLVCLAGMRVLGMMIAGGDGRDWRCSGSSSLGILFGKVEIGLQILGMGWKKGLVHWVVLVLVVILWIGRAAAAAAAAFG